MTCRKKHRVVAIHWLDAETRGGWSEDDPKEKPYIIVSIGIFIRKDRHFIHYADTHLGNRDYGNKSKIPVGMIKKIETIGHTQCGYLLK